VGGLVDQIHTEPDQGTHRASLVRRPLGVDRLERVEPAVGFGQSFPGLARFLNTLERMCRGGVDRLDQRRVEFRGVERFAGFQAEPTHGEQDRVVVGVRRVLRHQFGQPAEQGHAVQGIRLLHGRRLVVNLGIGRRVVGRGVVLAPLAQGAESATVLEA
jgi:hypothetical protein